MFELHYPEELAPMVPAPTASDLHRPRNTKPQEIFPIVDPTGIVIGRAERSYCHNGSKVLHPVVHLHIIDRMGNICLQKRSIRKEIQPGKWDTAVGGHISYGESITEALFRESSEELGFTEYNPIYIETYIFESEVDRELVNVFVAVGSSFVLKPDMDEVDECRFLSPEEIEDGRSKGTITPNFLSEWDMFKERFMALH